MSYYRQLIDFENPIISDGLIYSLDFANPLCYSGSGFTANDLITNDLLTIDSSSSFQPLDSNSFSQPTSVMLAQSSNIPTDLLGNKAFSVSGWFRRNSNFSGASAWGFGKSDTANNFNTFSPNVNEIAISLTNINAFGSGQQFKNTWTHVVWTKKVGVFSRANCEIYVDNVKYTGSGLTDIYGGEGTTPNILGDRKIAIGASSTLATQATSLRFGEFQIYNRVITDLEVAQNYNNTKARYGF